MTTLTDAELELLRQYDEKQVFDLCVELDFIPEEGYALEEILPRIVDELAAHLPTAPIPISKYDAEQLAEQFGDDDVRRLAQAMGLKWIPRSKGRTLGRIVTASSRRCRELGESSPFRWLVPILLPAVIRRLAAGPG